MSKENAHIHTDQRVNVTEATAICGWRSRQSLYRLLKKGEGPPHEVVAGMTVFDREKLKEWAETHRKRRGKRNGHQRKEG